MHDLRVADAELDARGYSRWLVRFLRRIAKIGLWYQVFDWEWGSLGAYDALLGYVPLCLGVTLLFALVGEFVLATILLVTTILLLVIAVVGLLGRRRRYEQDAT